MVLLPLVICLLGGGRSLFSEGLATLALGLIIVLAPPSYRLPKPLLLAAGAVIALPLLAYLPAEWVGASTEWRMRLSEDWGLQLPTSGTVQPWVTLESWLMLAVGTLWLIWGASRGTTTQDRRDIIRSLSTGITIVAVLTILEHYKYIYISWWQPPLDVDKTEHLGPFTNRNHTASLMAIGCVLCAASAYDALRRREPAFFYYIALFIPHVFVILIGTSRAALLLVFVGMTLWLWMASLSRRFLKKAVLITCVLLVGVSLLHLFGGSVLNRMSSGQTGASVQHRAELYANAVEMTAKSPWVGIGLGNFDVVFPTFSTLQQGLYRYTHPESDLIWILSEGGMLTLLAVLALVFQLALLASPWASPEGESHSDREDHRLRNAASVAALLAMLHGFVDVPNHNVAYGLLVMALIGIAVKSSALSTPASSWMKLSWRMAGLCIALVGAVWIGMASGRPIMPGASSARVLSYKALELSGENRDGDAIKLVDKAISWNPMNWSLYFQRAQIHLRLGAPMTAAVTDFGRARALEPKVGLPCVVEGEVWASHDLSYAISAWREALRRHPPYASAWFNRMIMKAYEVPALFPGLNQLATSPLQKLQLLEHYSHYPKELFEEILTSMVQKSPGVDSLDAAGRTRFFQIWWQGGDQAALINALKSNEAWQLNGWLILCEDHVKNGRYQEAYTLARSYQPPPLNPSISGMAPLPQLEQNFLFNPTDPRRGLDLYFAYKSKGDWGPALATLEKISVLPNAPAYLNYEMAVVYAEKGDFRRAWELMFQYLNRPK